MSITEFSWDVLPFFNDFSDRVVVQLVIVFCPSLLDVVGFSKAVFLLFLDFIHSRFVLLSPSGILSCCCSLDFLPSLIIVADPFFCCFLYSYPDFLVALSVLSVFVISLIFFSSLCTSHNSNTFSATRGFF